MLIKMDNQFFYKREFFTSDSVQDFPATSKHSQIINRLANDSSILLFSLDTNGIITLLDGQILTMLAIEKKDYLGTSIFDQVIENVPLLKSIKNAIINKYPTSVFEHKDNTIQIYYTSKCELNGKVSGIIGCAIDVTEQKKSENIIRKKNEQISLIFGAGKIISNTLNINKLYETLLDIITKAAECDALFVASFDSNDNMIRYTFLRDRLLGENIDTSKIPPIPLAPEGYGIISNVVRTGKAVILNNYQEELKKVKIKFDVQLNAENKKDIPHSKNMVGSAIIVPIMFEDSVTGIIQIFCSRLNAYNREQLEIIEALMQPIGIAINNAQLYLNAQNEIKERKIAEEKISRSLKEKELLLKEVHHRVKNNLQLVKSLISLQSKHIQDKALIRLFNESRDRIQSVALIHELLYQGENITEINFLGYIKKLTAYLLHSTGEANSEKYDVEITGAKINLSIDIAIPCGLIVNELFTNALKHAFKHSEKGSIKIKLAETADETTKLFELAVIDNGTGLPRENYPTDVNKSMGMRIINSLVKQISGKIIINSAHGTEIRVLFPPANYRNRI